MLSDDEDEMPKNEMPATQSKASSSKGEAITAKKRPSGTLYTAAVHTTTVTAKEGLTDVFYIDSGASDRPSKGDLRGYIELEQPVEIATTNRGNFYAHRHWIPASSASGCYRVGGRPRRPGVGHLPERRWNESARSGGGGFAIVRK